MFLTIVKKEILDALLSHRFAIATALCLVLIPLGMYVNLKDYDRRLADYHEAVQLYEQDAKGRISKDFQAEGYRPPSILSVFAAGLEQAMPNKFTTSSEGVPGMANAQGVDNAKSLLFGHLDLR